MSKHIKYKDLIKAFDFEKVRSIMYLTKRDMHVVPSIKEMKEQAGKLIRMTFDHQDREFWWAGGQHHGGLCASYDDKWGILSHLCSRRKESKSKGLWNQYESNHRRQRTILTSTSLDISRRR